MPGISIVKRITAPISFTAYLQLIREQAGDLYREVTKIQTEAILERDSIYTMDIEQMIHRLIEIRIEMIKIQKQLRAYKKHITQIPLSDIANVSSALDDIGDIFPLYTQVSELSRTYAQIREYVYKQLSDKRV